MKTKTKRVLVVALSLILTFTNFINLTASADFMLGSGPPNTTDNNGINNTFTTILGSESTSDSSDVAGPNPMPAPPSAETEIEPLPESGDNNAVSGENPLENAEAEVNESEGEESSTKEKIDQTEADLIKDFNDSEKEAYTIIANKYMTESDINAFKWNMIISQFTIPYFNNIQDVLQTSMWTQMKDNNLDINTNPYIDALGNCLETLSSDEVVAYLTELVDGAVENYKFADIYNILMENGEVVYSPIYKKDGTVAYITDMFEDDELDDTVFYVKDKVALTGEALSADNLTSAYEAMNEEYLYNAKTKKDLATAIQTGNKVEDIEFPVWIQTDSTLMYNSIFVNNAIRVGNFGTYEEFIKSLGNSQLYIDRWGNICAYCRYGNDYRYVTVYPAYANPLITSTELNEDDIAGYGYYDFDNSEFWKVGSTPDATWSANAADEINGGSTAYAFINDEAVLKTYEEVKSFCGSEGMLDVESDTTLGIVNKEGIAKSFTKYFVNYTTSNGDKENVGGIYSRKSDGSTQTNKELIPYIQVDTTNNFMLNKTILAAYTRDSYNVVTNNSKYYASDHLWYDCMQESQSTYTKFNSITDYNANNASGLFSNSIVLDKYPMKGYIIGATGTGNDYGAYCLQSDTKIPLMFSSATIGTHSINNSNGVFSNGGLVNYFLDGTKGLHITDPGNTSDKAYTLYPYMLLHSYRKGIYSESPTLQSNKSGDFWTLQHWFRDCITAPSMDIENMISMKEDYNKGIFSYKEQPIEVLWNWMATDSDRFKTFVTLNYPSNLVPNNSTLYGMNRTLKDSGEGSELYYQPKYYENNLELFSGKTAGRKYVSIGLFDPTIDLAQDWGIWTTSLKPEEYIVDSVITEVRDRSIESYNEDNFGLNKSSTAYLSPVKIDTEEGDNVLRYLLCDQRVSDVLENYPLEDITLLSFIWLNYYIPQTPINHKVNFIELPDLAAQSAQAGTNALNSADPVPETGVSVTTVTGDETGVTSEPISENAKGNIDGKEVFIGNTDGIYPDRTMITQSSVICGDNCTNTLLWTISQDAAIENSLTAGGDGGVGAGRAPSLVVSDEYINRVTFNYGAWMLAINKNTHGDNLTHLIGNLDTAEEFETEDIKDYIIYFLKHPVVSISNIYVGFVQLIHNAIACSNVGNLFNITWVIDKLIEMHIMQWYLIISTIFIIVIFVYRMISDLIHRDAKLSNSFRNMAITIMASSIPVLLLFSLNGILDALSRIALKSASNKISLVEMECDVRETEALNVNFEVAYQMFRDQFEGINYVSTEITLPVPVGWDSFNKELKYTNIPVKDLYNSVSYSERLTSAITEATLAEASADANMSVKDYYTECSDAVTYMYYNYENFTPVSYKDYDTSIFYYFYDYVKYQYLRYWASIPDSEGSVFTSAAKNFTLPDSENEELWSTYATRMWDAERYMLLKSYNGMYNMYNDKDYVYSSYVDKNGKTTYYQNDLFGLSNLFNMTEAYNSNQFQGYLSTVYHNAKSNGQPLEYWQETVKALFENGASDYGSYLSSIVNTTNSATGTTTNQSNAVQNNFYPLAYFMDSYTWDAMMYNGDLATRYDASKFNEYYFTPCYLLENYPEWYTQYPDTTRLTDHLSVINAQRSNSLLLNNLNGRLFGRVYGAQGPLMNHIMRNPESSIKDVNNVTPLEKKLMKVNKNIYKEVRSQLKYLQGDIRDSTLIFNTALICTYEFNKEFSGGVFETQIQPQYLATEALDLDKFMRATYANDIDDLIKNPQLMYMIFGSGSGIMACTFVCLSEVLIAVIMVIRVIILLLMFVASAIVCVSFTIIQPRDSVRLFIGVLCQYLGQIGVHILTLGVLVISISASSISWATTSLISGISLLSYIGVVGLQYILLKSFLKSVKTFGGNVFVEQAKALAANFKDSILDAKDNLIDNHNLYATFSGTLGSNNVKHTRAERLNLMRRNTIGNVSSQLAGFKKGLKDDITESQYMVGKDGRITKRSNLTAIEKLLRNPLQYRSSRSLEEKTYKVKSSTTIDKNGNVRTKGKTRTLNELKQLAKDNTATNNYGKQRLKKKNAEQEYLMTGRGTSETIARVRAKETIARNTNTSSASNSAKRNFKVKRNVSSTTASKSKTTSTNNNT